MTAGTVPSTVSRTGIPTAGRNALARYFNAYRVAAYLMIVYTLGHTFGAVTSTPQFGPDSDAVALSMKTVHVVAQGTDRTWYDFYQGFGA